MVEEHERRAWIAIASVRDIGPDRHYELIARFGPATSVIEAAVAGHVRTWVAKERQIRRGPVIPDTALGELEHLPSTIDGRLAEIEDQRLWTRTPLDLDYPTRLTELDPAPPVIHGWGDRALLDAPRSVAVVGTRRPTPSGRLLAGRIAARLVEWDAVVVSGVAVGIDGAAHASTLAHNGKTVGVIGGGHRFPGPRAHAALRSQIVDSGGALISEHHPSIEPTRGTYPRRNRIIAGLGDATVVVEAPSKSGALITARIAMELGRLTLVAPGRIGEWATAGCLRLLRDSPARPLIGIDEMVADLGFDGTAGVSRPATTALSASDAIASLGAAERTVAERLRRAPAGLDVLVDDTGLAPSVVSGAVTLLLLRGWIQAIGPAFLPAGPLLVG